MKKKEKLTEMVRHAKSTQSKVAKFVVDTKYSIGSFYDEAANEKIAAMKLERKLKSQVNG